MRERYDRSTILFKGSTPPAPFSVARGHLPCLACAFNDHIVWYRSLSSTTCAYICRTLGGRSRFPHKSFRRRQVARLGSLLGAWNSTIKAEIFGILTDDRRRVKSHRLLFCLRKLPILAHEGTPSDELRFGTSSPQIGSRNLGLCVRILTPFRIAKGIDQKPLTVYFLRKARELYKTSPEKGLSPSFWDAEGIETQASTRFDGILPGLEHALGAWTYLW